MSNKSNFNLNIDSSVKAGYELISAALFNRTPNTDNNTDWQQVYSYLYSQTMETIPGNFISKLPLSPELKMQWKSDSMWRIGNFYKVLHAQNELVSLLTQANIRFAILKGCAAAVYYPNPAYRAMGDIDFIVDPEQFELAYSILTENGFTDTDCEFTRHISFEKDGCELEMHRYFSLRGNSDSATGVDDCIFDGLQNTLIKSIDGNSFPVLPELQNGLILLQHIKHHIHYSLGLRQITDWMMYVNNVLNDKMWNDCFCDEAEKAGLKDLAVAVTRMCRLYFGLDNDEITWCDNADKKLCAQLLEHINACGNMGHNRTDNVQKTLKYNNGFTNTVLNLQKRGLNGWKAAERFPILRYFAWFRQIIHYIKTAIKDKISIGKIYKYSKIHHSTQEMLDKLGCSENIVGE